MGNEMSIGYILYVNDKISRCDLITISFELGNMYLFEYVQIKRNFGC